MLRGESWAYFSWGVMSAQIDIWREGYCTVRVGGDDGVWLGATEREEAAGVAGKVWTVWTGEGWVGAGVVRGT